MILRGRTERVTYLPCSIQLAILQSIWIAVLRLSITVTAIFVRRSNVSVIVIQPMPGCYRIFSLGGEDVDEVWREHVRDEGTLASYSEAMRGLATGQWRRYR